MRWPFRRKSLIPGEPRSGITVVQSLPALVRLHDETRSFDSLYRESAAVRAVVDFLAQNVAQLPLKCYERGEGRDRERLPNADPLVRLLDRPNRRTTGRRFIRDAVTDLSVHGNSFAVKVRDDAGRVGALVRIPPVRVSTVADDSTEVAQYRVMFSAGQKDYPADDVLHFRLHAGDGLMGISPLESLRAVLAEDLAASKHRAAFWRNAARREGIIERPLEAPDWSDEARKRFRADWQSAAAGAENAGGTAILEEGMAWKDSSFSPRDSQFLEGRRLSLELVAGVYGVPLQVVGGSERNLREGRRVFLSEVVTSWTAVLEDEMSLSLVPDVKGDEDDEVFIEFDLLGSLRGDAFLSSEFLQQAVGEPFLDVDEARAALNLPPKRSSDRGSRSDSHRTPPSSAGVDRLPVTSGA